MSIKLTKKVAGTEVELDLISLNGKTVIRDASYEAAKNKKVTKKALKEAGFEIESDVLKGLKTKKAKKK